MDVDGGRGKIYDPEAPVGTGRSDHIFGGLREIRCSRRHSNIDDSYYYTMRFCGIMT